MAALASYARQSEDEALRRLAVRIQARALRRCSEVLREIKPANGTRTDLQPSAGARTRSRVAENAGLSRHQRVTALRIGNIPESEFEALIESDDPPTWGKSSREHLRGRSPEDFGSRPAELAW